MPFADCTLNLIDELKAGPERGWRFTPLDGKRPLRTSWQKEPPLSYDELPDAVERGRNINLRTGSRSIATVWVVDVAGGGGRLE